ncbi:MAG: hypothetical protein PHW04_12090, partial [Candidatus Wallbacteria bacterium]|nr:hypothetical protein [Candidatus Wallbacteria bacterium]
MKEKTFQGVSKMGNYDFKELSPRSFEQMIQALSYKILGPGLVVFGDGPDGGREATFHGCTSKFPSSTQIWNGYTVVQAKFCQRPKGNLSIDTKWLLNELKKELDSFAASESKRKKPEYYILVTNLVLSPVQDKGGKDKAVALINLYKKRLGLKDFRVWDYDQLCGYLDNNKDVRCAYALWTTPGDVLSKLAAVAEGLLPDFIKVMLNFLQKELLDDHYSKLEQAGHSPENRIPLEQVFIDLPTFFERRSEAPIEDAQTSQLPPGFLSYILQKESICFKPGEIFSFYIPNTITSLVSFEEGRYVLVGGPGQGKSTLTQFLCQIHRVNLLNNRSCLDKDVVSAINSIIAQCKVQCIDITCAKRFPFRIELANFAKTLATTNNNEVTSVLSYIASTIKERTQYQVTVNVLRIWLKEHPWLLIFDGLDEVPPSSNRKQILDSIRDFLVDVSTCEADVLILATTRPQGYNDEFSPTRYEHSWLAPLSIARALHYGKNLVELTYHHFPQRKKEIMDRLQEAVKIDASARLMGSPLQVTIMARLLAQIAKPPQERYKLFHQYYKVIYRREMERGVQSLSQLLQDYEADIDTIHFYTGLLLQIESEKTQHTDATLTIEDFKNIVRGRLSIEGHSVEERNKLADEITNCATDRLVFLVPSQSGRVGFEIRSLQEFMAAEALLEGKDDIVVERVNAIAGIPFWQNVLLFAAGKCYAERQWLRDSLTGICATMNDNPNDTLSHIVHAGSRIALSLLEDGSLRKQPRCFLALTRKALSLLTLPPSHVHDRLADVYEPENEDVFREEVEHFLNHHNIIENLGVWRLLLRLTSKRSTTWAYDLAEKHWPSETKSQQIIFDNMDIFHHWLIKKYLESFFNMPYLLPRDFGHSFNDAKERLGSIKKESIRYALDRELSVFRPKRCVSFSISSRNKLLFPIIFFNENRKSPPASIGKLKQFHPYWTELIASCQFIDNPSSVSLCNALSLVASKLPIIMPHKYRLLGKSPWPLAVCVSSENGPI